MKKIKTKIGFTLAEVLITLGIVGVIAALTLPILFREYEEQQIVSAFKKDFSDINGAVNSLKADNGGTLQGTTVDNLISKLSILKDCSNSSSQGCWHSDTTIPKMLSGANWSWPGTGAGRGIILVNGAYVLISGYNGSCNSTMMGLTNACAFIVIDVNGSNGPNIFGRDSFELYIHESGVIPAGIKGNRSETTPTSYGCREAGGNPNGEGCSKRVLYENAINY